MRFGMNLQEHREKDFREDMSSVFTLAVRHYNAGLTSWCKMLEIHKSEKL